MREERGMENDVMFGVLSGRIRRGSGGSGGRGPQWK